jgi:hypothetical protein
MAKGRGDVMIVEFIDPDRAVDWSGSTAPMPSQRPPGRRPWLPGTIAVASLIAAGVWLSNSVPDAAPPPTQPTDPVVDTTRPTTTSPSGSMFSENGFLITPPDGMQLQGAWEGESGMANPAGMTEATWATPGASLDQGSWIYIRRVPEDPLPFIFTGQVRLPTPAGAEVQVSQVDSPSMISAWQFGPGYSVWINASGWSIDDVIRVFDAIDHNQPEIALIDATLLGDHQLVSDRGNPWTGNGPGPTAGAWYFDEQTGTSISVEISPDEARGGDIELDRLLLGEQSQRSIRRIDPFKIVVTGDVDQATLEEVTSTLRRASNDEWNEALRAARTPSDEPAPRTQLGPWVATSDLEWRVSTWDEFVNVAVKLDDASVTEIGLSTLGEVGASTTFGSGSSIDRTYIAASSPLSGGPTILRVTAGDESFVEAPFVDASIVSGAAVALAVIESPGPYIAEVIGADGIVLATWTSDEALQG